MDVVGPPHGGATHGPEEYKETNWTSHEDQASK